jgi:N-acetylglucosamine kinase-like BadF-type ATPase
LRHFLGVDGGGSKCDAVLMDENGVVLGWGVGGPVNYRPMEDILQSFDDALAGALHSFTAGELWVGLICGGGHVARRLAERGIEAHLHGVGEIEGGYLAALQPWGIMALSGTGSFIHGRRPDGRELHLGGLGPILGDEGALGAGSVWSIVDLFHGHHLTRGVMARLAPLVDEAARAGDEVACDIMSRSAIGLAEILAVVLEELSLAGQSYPVFGLGGVAQGSPFFWDLFAAEALRRDPTLQLTVPPVRLAVGAAFGAMVQAGVEVNASLRDTVVASQDAFPPSLVRTKMTLI